MLMLSFYLGIELTGDEKIVINAVFNQGKDKKLSEKEFEKLLQPENFKRDEKLVAVN